MQEELLCHLPTLPRALHPARRSLQGLFGVPRLSPHVGDSCSCLGVHLRYAVDLGVSHSSRPGASSLSSGLRLSPGEFSAESSVRPRQFLPPRSYGRSYPC